MYFDWDYWWRVVRATWSFKSWPGRNKMLLKLLLWVPLTAVGNTLCFLLDYLLFPSLWRQQVVRPVFIVGHARSGTTLLHRLMAADTERFSYFLYWETLFPSLLQKKLIRALGVADRRWLGDAIDTRLKAWDEKTFGQFRHIHNMGLWTSEEDQFVMRGAFVTQQWSLEMPLFEHMDIFHIDDLPDAKRRRWMHHYKECVKRQLLLNGGNKTHLSKNPLWSGWLNAIIETFPDARIAVCVRNPMECIPSVLKLLEGNWKARGWQRSDYEAALQHMADISIESFTRPKAALDANPQTPQVFVDYRQLIGSPAATLESVFQALDLPVSEQYRSYLSEQEQREKRHHSEFHYKLADYAITAERIEDELGDWFEQYNWPLSARARLRRAWNDMMDSLQTARDAIDQPALMPPPNATGRLQAEGYRYLLGFAHAAIERAFHEDRDAPTFRNLLSPMTRATIDNADAIYFYAPIDGSKSYWLRGKAGDTSDWRGESVAAVDERGAADQTQLLQSSLGTSDRSKAPHYLIFEASWGNLSGDSGKLTELRPGMRIQTGRLDSSSIAVGPDGAIEILLAPERPDGYEGNFISTLKVVKHPHPEDPSIPNERFASYLSGRQLFGDWDNEEAIHFSLEPLEPKWSDAPEYSVDRAVAELRRCGELARNQMLFWNAFWTIPMGTYGERKGSIPGVAFPRNAFNTINAASGATGGGMSTNLYAGGVFELEPDEALIVEMAVPLMPQYMGFQLGNLWGESLEYGSRISSLNLHQLVRSDDGKFRLVVAHKDPGVANWLDTTGQREGFMAPRWAYSETPSKEVWPTITAKKVRLADVTSELPSDMPAVSPDERLLQIAARQRHVQRRFRAF